jgi:ubiquinol-cytochrome c reductase cytochrome c1 subunit
VRTTRRLAAALAAISLGLAATLAAGPANAAAEGVKLDDIGTDVTDVASLQSGARTFVNWCLNCHSASLMRYNALREIGLTDEQIKDNLMFTAEKVGLPMAIAMSPRDAKDWFGSTPPDLSVIARSRGADWLYTYLRSFYRDPSTLTGWNNLVYPNVGMPHVLWKLQGERVASEQDAVRDGRPILGEDGKPRKLVKLEPLTPGSQSTLEYDKTVYDLVNFLTWMGEPHQMARKRLGMWVLIGLTVLIFLAYFLKQAYWKDVH